MSLRVLLVNIAKKLGIYKKMVDIDTYFKNRKKFKQFHKYGVETFVLMDNICRKAGAQLLPIFGTQLGFYRDHGFIPHDNDIDTAMLFSQRPDNLVDIMAENGFKIETSYYIKGENKPLIEQYSRKGVHIDIFYLFDYNDVDWFCYVVERHESTDWREANRTNGFPCHIWPLAKCNFTEKEYFGHNFFMPEKTEEWLKGVFGANFMTPIKNWTLDKEKEPTRVIHTKQRLYRIQY